MSNPFVCNCGLKWLKNWLKLGNLATGNPKCSSPERLKDHSMTSLIDKEFLCDSTQSLSDECGNSLMSTRLVVSTCPTNCTCQSGIVRCSHLGMKQIPNDIPEDVKELYT